MLSSASPYLSLPGFVIALFGLVALAAACWIYFKASTGQALIKQQDMALHAQELRLDEQGHQIEEQSKKIDALVQQNESQAAEIKRLTELVTQAAKVDALIRAVEDGFGRLDVKVRVGSPQVDPK